MENEIERHCTCNRLYHTLHTVCVEGVVVCDVVWRVWYCVQCVVVCGVGDIVWRVGYCVEGVELCEGCGVV